MKAVVLACLLAALAAVVWWFVTDDPSYRLHELSSLGRYDSQNELILASGRRYGVPPELIKAVIWRESRFHPEKTGAHGERGLMQITEAAAQDWAKAEKIETFAPTDLFDPKVNIEAGSWYLSRALHHWKSKEDPIPFALAEYNAGRTRVHRWVKDSGRGDVAEAGDLQAAMDFPGTKSYITGIIERYNFYKRHGDPSNPAL